MRCVFRSVPLSEFCRHLNAHVRSRHLEKFRAVIGGSECVKNKPRCFRCACRTSGSDYSKFEKILESDDGLHIYCYVSQGNVRDTSSNKETTVLVLHNTTDDELSTLDIQKHLELVYSCPRCIYMYKRAQNLLRHVPSIDKRQTTGICEHCVKKMQGHLTSCKCDEAVKKFLSYSLKKKLYHIKDSNANEKHGTKSDTQIGKDFRQENIEHKVIQSKSENSTFKSTLANEERPAAAIIRQSDMEQDSIKQFKKSIGSTPQLENAHMNSREDCSDYKFVNTLDEKSFRYSFPIPRTTKTPIISQVTSSDLIQGVTRRNEETRIIAEERHKQDFDKKNVEEENIRTAEDKASTKIKLLDKSMGKNGANDKEQNLINEKKSTSQNIISEPKDMKSGKKSTNKNDSPMKDLTNAQVEIELEQNKNKQKVEKEIKSVNTKLKNVNPKKNLSNTKAAAPDTKSRKTYKTEKETKGAEQSNTEKSPNTDATDGMTKEDKAAEMLKHLIASHKKTEDDKKSPKQKLDTETSKAKTGAIQRTSKDIIIVSLIELHKKEVSRKKRKNKEGLNKTSSKAGSKLKEGALKHVHSNSNLDLEVESSIVVDDLKLEEVPRIVVGEKIMKYKPPILKNDKGNEDSLLKDFEQYEHSGFNSNDTRTDTDTPKKVPKTDSRQGILKFALSDEKFIAKGWTMLPTQKIVRKMHLYRMRTSHPEFDWFNNNKKKGQMLYDSGERLAEFKDDGSGCLFYRTGKLALDYYNAEESHVQQRYVVYSTGEPDQRGRPRPRTILATFDYIGNCVVFDLTGKIRLKYNQTEGVVLDQTIGPISHWKWHTLNDPPELQQVMIDTHAPQKDSRLLEIKPHQGDVNAVIKNHPSNEAMLAIEFGNFIKDKNKKVSQTFKPFQIRMKAFKINENFSLRILDQATIYLTFRDGSTNVKLNMGMILDHTEIVDTVTAEVGDCSVSLEKLPACSDSVAALQATVACAQRQELARARRERLLRPAVPAASADRLRTATSRPLRSQLVPTHRCTSEVCGCTF